MKLTPYRYVGPGVHLGRHGLVKNKAVLWLDEPEVAYVTANPNPDLEKISEDEAAKITPPKMTGDGSPEGAEDGQPEDTGAEAERYEIGEMEKSLIEDYSKKELVALCQENDVAFETDANKPALAKLLAPVIVKKNREESKD